jgi:N-acetylmuramoyl-L-alanine amidase
LETRRNMPTDEDGPILDPSLESSGSAAFDYFTQEEKARILAPPKWLPSPHHSSRKGHRPEALVLHIMEGTLLGTDAWFQDETSGVSTHYGIGLEGETHQYVDTQYAAWANGRVLDPTWKGIKPKDIGLYGQVEPIKYANPNRYTLSIEHEGHGEEPWPDEMLQASLRLVRALCVSFRIPMDREHIIGHREIYAAKTCPGGWLMSGLDQYVGWLQGRALGPHEGFQAP